MKAIKHVKQPTSDTCMAACMAMLCGDEQIDPVFHRLHYVECSLSAVQYLLQRGVNARRPVYAPHEIPHRMHRGFVYLLNTISLNWENSAHAVLVDFRGESPIVYDPNLGKGNGLLAYKKIGNDVGNLRFWTVEAVIDLDSSPLHTIPRYAPELH
ncbi:hypothetical protein phiVC8_p37 [Vibrio phage phiVC8]|uniref:Uncharacterized protein n=1 Tax=Vibrio phage phiVC8 TaxID=1076759 RepID=G3FFP6_BPVC8|nr:hypothetical protein phiVC8_p37 [Vibrio phage phiVC8]AEM62934.1 hypothetical protein phiVC8_p37 [Vibrio phage phiVC8]